MGPIAILRNWTFCLFYVMAELWGSVVVSLLFWGFANQVGHTWVRNGRFHLLQLAVGFGGGVPPLLGLCQPGGSHLGPERTLPPASACCGVRWWCPSSSGALPTRWVTPGSGTDASTCFSLLWGSVVVSLLFWGFANQVTHLGPGQELPPASPYCGAPCWCPSSSGALPTR